MRGLLQNGSKEALEIEIILSELYQWLQSIPHLKHDIIVDDRGDKTIGKRLLEAKLFGFPFVVVASREACQETPLYELHDINAGKNYLMPRSVLTQFLIDKMRILDEEDQVTWYITKT